MVRNLWLNLLIMFLYACIGLSSCTDDEDSSDQAVQNEGDSGVELGDANIKAIIVKASGPEPGQDPEDHPDAITSATMADVNTHVFVDTLVTVLAEKGVSTDVYHHFECPALSCVEDNPADILVLAAPTQAGVMLNQISALIPSLNELSPSPAVCSGLTSCGMGPGIDKFMQSMEDTGVNTVPGIALQADDRFAGSVVTEEEMLTALGAFADELIAAVP